MCIYIVAPLQGALAAGSARTSQGEVIAVDIKRAEMDGFLLPPHVFECLSPLSQWFSDGSDTLAGWLDFIQVSDPSPNPWLVGERLSKICGSSRKPSRPLNINCNHFTL
jgi:hypothetical protein